MTAPGASGAADRAKDVFLDALERGADERDAFVGAACAGDAELAARVRALLDAHGRASGVLQGTPPLPSLPHLPARPAQDDDAAPGASVGSYRLVRELGAGGFGTVWLAEQIEPVRRDVAVKVLKAGMDTREVVARFEAERQALARMDHPGIARIFDGGSTERGRPYFAMEYVDGEPITDYCARRRLGVRARVELLVAVCHAVQHAHQKGVVHRDLKPSNVLVSETTGARAPKVIDFGIAKAIEGSLTGRTLATRAGQAIGTPSYMAPEQLTGEGDIDTRADVYGLGALLYELLCGSPPHELAPGLGGAALMRWQIAEAEPRRPSARLVAKSRAGSSTPPIAPREVRGELDWIAMRCLEKDRERRYDSVAVLANDLVRSLRGEPVLAGPPTLRYRASRFARRHARSLALVVAIFVGLVVALALIEAEARRAREAERESRAELARADAAAGFLEDLLMSVDPAVAQGRDVSVLLAMLARAAARVEQASQGLPGVEAQLRRIVGGAYYALARYDEAEEQLRRALELRRETLGERHPDTLRSAEEYAGALGVLGRTPEALELMHATAATLREEAGERAESTLRVLALLGSLLAETDRPAEALPILRAVEEARLAELGPDDPATILATNNLAQALANTGDLAGARERYERALEFQLETEGRRHPRTLAAMNNLATTLEALGESERALETHERILEVKREVLPPGHPSLVIGLNNLASAFERAERLEESDALRDEALEQARTHLGLESRFTLTVMFNKALGLLQRDRPAEARALLEEMVGPAAGTFGEDASILHAARSALAHALLATGEARAAEPLARAALAAALRLHPEGHETVVIFRARLALVLAGLGEGDPEPALSAAHTELVAEGLVDLARTVAAALAEHCAERGNDADGARWRAASLGR